MVALKTLVFTILVPGTVTVIIPWHLLQGAGGLVLPGPSLWMVGLLPLLLGVGLYVWCAGAFTFIGKGTPAPIDAPRVLVTQGGLSMDAQSHVRGSPVGSDRGSHPVPVSPACWLCPAPVGRISCLCGLRRGATASPPIWSEL